MSDTYPREALEELAATDLEGTSDSAWDWAARQHGLTRQPGESSDSLARRAMKALLYPGAVGYNRGD